jgi:hypothetical protein
VALRLRRRGITRVHPLQGGLAGWMALNFPVETVALAALGNDALGSTAPAS